MAAENIIGNKAGTLLGNVLEAQAAFGCEEDPYALDVSMGVAPGSELRQLRSRQQEIIRLASLGMSNQDIAREAGVALATVTNVVHSKLGRAKLAEIEAGRDQDTRDLKEEIDAAAPAAIELLKNICAGRSDSGLPVSMKLRMDAARELLDRGGKYIRVTKTEAEISHGVIGALGGASLLKERGAAMRQRLLEAQAASDVDIAALA